MEKACLMLKKKNILIPVKIVKKALYKIIAIGEKDQAQLQIVRTSGNLQPRKKVRGLSGWKITERTHQA